MSETILIDQNLNSFLLLTITIFSITIEKSFQLLNNT